MVSPRLFIPFMAVLCLGLGSVVQAQWSSDPAQNLAIADRSSEQVVPKIACASDGSCYVGWYDLASGNYDVYLQRLDVDGYELWPHNGICISNHPQNSSVTDWDLIADSDGGAVLVFADARDGFDLDIHAYRVSPQGELLWGPDGVTLSSNAEYEPAPRVIQASDGDFVFVWADFPDTEDGCILMQRLSPDGEERFASGGIPVVVQAGESPGFPTLVPAASGRVIVCWVRDLTTLYTPRHLRAQAYSAGGTPLWPAPVNVYDQASVPLGYGPDLFDDGAGGALVLWHRSLGNMYNSLVQHLDGTGHEIFPHNGIVVSTLPSRHHVDPTLSYRIATGEIFVFWNERDSGQESWGICGQKFTPAGVRAWGDAGVTLVGIDDIFKSTQRSVPCADGAMVFYVDEPGGYAHARVVGLRVDGAGALVWPGSPIEISSLQTKKARLPIVVDPWGAAKLVWEDGRNDFSDVYGQNVNPDGSLGPSSGTVVGQDELFQPVASFPNPFRAATRIVIAGETPGTGIRILDAAGRRVCDLPLQQAAGAGQSVLWDGTNGHGERLPGGVYLLQILGARDGDRGRRLVLIR